MKEHRKKLGQFFTPDFVAHSLVKWTIRTPRDLLLDPSCGDGAFLQFHKRSVGIEVDPANAARARQRAPSALVHGGDFFCWALATKERFDAVAGNPPFIRYQNFDDEIRELALAASAQMGAKFNRLTSSWAPFVLVASGLLKANGRMAFVVPAELGHSNYAKPLLPALCARFSRVQVIACREKLFPMLSEDCWLLYCEGAQGKTDEIQLTVLDEFTPGDVIPAPSKSVGLNEWKQHGERLRPFLLPQATLQLYRELARHPSVRAFGDLAAAGIGYVTGDNDFFHLRPSEARQRGIPEHLLKPTIRKGDQLPLDAVRSVHVKQWITDDEPILLLALSEHEKLPSSVARYLDEEPGHKARTATKCRTRDPWYVVPDVKVPDAFLSVMTGGRPALVRNEAGCVCTNTLHAVHFRSGIDAQTVQKAWQTELPTLGFELEGHPLGGGMLKIEPREAAKVPVPIGVLQLTRGDLAVLEEGVRTMRAWRHDA